jgi:integrase/recombinase XerD
LNEGGRLVIRIRQGNGVRDHDVLLSSNPLETFRDHWRWMKPQTYLFPGTVKGWHVEVPITPKVLRDAVVETRREQGVTILR